VIDIFGAVVRQLDDRPLFRTVVADGQGLHVNRRRRRPLVLLDQVERISSPGLSVRSPRTGTTPRNSRRNT
jgi:hypothetical protein